MDILGLNLNLDVAWESNACARRVIVPSRPFKFVGVSFRNFAMLAGAGEMAIRGSTVTVNLARVIDVD